MQNKDKVLALCVSVACFLVSAVYAENLSELAVKFNTDKGPQLKAGKGGGYNPGHNYVSVYAQYFEPLRNKPIRLVEIGLAWGESARTWEAYFDHPKTAFYFLDINNDLIARAQEFLSARSHCCFVDQSSPEQLKKFAQDTGGDFDIVIDDGSHLVSHQIISFKTLFPFVRPGGMYIVEDLHTSYAGWGLVGGKNFIDFARELVDNVNYAGARTFCADKKKFKGPLTEYQRDIRAVFFYSSLVFILKEPV